MRTPQPDAGLTEGNWIALERASQKHPLRSLVIGLPLEWLTFITFTAGERPANPIPHFPPKPD